MRVITLTTVLALAAPLARAANIILPTLYSCGPAVLQISARGNYTIEGRDFDSHKLLFRAHIDKGITTVNWDPVNLASNSTAAITVFDQLRNSTAVTSALGPVLASPNGNTTCLVASKSDKDSTGKNVTKQKNMVPTIVGIALGAFLLLVLLLVGGMMYRRKKEKTEKIEEDDMDFGNTQGTAPGSSYMRRLVPGLKLQDARPLPRDPVLESEQANYSSTRRGTQYYHSPEIRPGGYELPSYRQSQHGSKLLGTSASGNANQPNPQNPARQWSQNQHQPYLQRQQSTPTDPFASQADIQTYPTHLQQQSYHQHGWQHSQASFLDHKGSQ